MSNPTEVMVENEILLSATGLEKSYGHVKALQGVDLELRAGSITAIVGDNGAGKSTLISLLSGLRRPDRGTIELSGEPVVLQSPRHATEVGITTVFQNLALVNVRDVADNLYLGHEPTRLRWFVDRRAMRAGAREVLERLKVDCPDVRAQVGQLSGGQRQAIAVARAVLQGSRMFLMDEPTAALGMREADRVMALMNQLRDDGGAVLLVSHNIESVFSIADRIAVFRLGRKILEVDTHATSREEIVGLIVGAKEGQR
jgi:D-xylose transport system ATP-binding protein